MRRVRNVCLARSFGIGVRVGVGIRAGLGIGGCPVRRGLCTSSVTALSELWGRFKEEPDSFMPVRQRAPQADDIFPNSNLKLGDIDAYGFDYDYTLANYNKNVMK